MVTNDYQGEHPDSAMPTALMSLARCAYYGSVPPWPATMIEPSGSELARWAQLWSHPRASVWVETKQEHLVATLVRAEQRCGHKRPSPLAEFEVDRIRRQLGLGDN
jgi:hypothetical protein